MCKDCGKDTHPVTKAGRCLFKKWDFYLVRDEVWLQAGMAGWASGYLCTPCLSKRIGRDLTDADYLARTVGPNKEGLKVAYHPDYHDVAKRWEADYQKTQHGPNML
jgi:hypothetical protein